jgi:hypothetical protein
MKLIKSILSDLSCCLFPAVLIVIAIVILFAVAKNYFPSSELYLGQ